MKYNPDIHHRRSIRLKGYDYAQAGLYFVTICCQNRAHLYGKITDGKMILNDAGQFAQKCWTEIPDHFPNTQLHEHIIMPNHIHGIIEIVCADDVRANDYSPQRRPSSPSKTIGSIIRGYKIGVTKWFRENQIDKFPVGQSVWQRNYWEHIIRDEKSYHNIAEYIISNPLKWDNDTLNTIN